jgi:squalene-hopene/tetraprenyl-beta-curcumene cyclase
LSGRQLPLIAESVEALDRAVEAATTALLTRQQPDGHWAFELEADATIPAEYVLLTHYLDDRDIGLERKIATYLRRIRGEHGGWPLFHGGDLDISASVKAYFALKAVGDDPQASHMAEARQAILRHGGAARANVFTRTLLALFGQVPWTAVPVMPVEIMLLPRWFPFHLDKVSYWSRTVLVPLLVLMALKPQARNPQAVAIQELFLTSPLEVRDWPTARNDSAWGKAFRALDRALRVAEPYFPKAYRQRAIDRAMAFVAERLNGEDGLGAIYPAMANTVMMFDALGIGAQDPRRATARRAIDRLLVIGEDSAYCQPCLSPVWDTALACHALCEAGGAEAATRRAAEWLLARQETRIAGDWAARRPSLEPGGWAFQYSNPHYPDTDDTAAVVTALERIDAPAHRDAVALALRWLRGMQCTDGGWGAFDADNTHVHLNAIPFADHGALLDPPTADVGARCVSALAALGNPEDQSVRRGVEWLLCHQEVDGSWFGRWGTNYIYGTWSALAALNAAGVDSGGRPVRRAVDWLLSRQREDGGWGEDGRSYWDGQPHGIAAAATPSQTAWALLGLMAAGEVDHPAVARGIAWLLANRNDEGGWDEPQHTAVGFPRVFYLRYHGYRLFFPLWAVARYRNLVLGNRGRVLHGL